MKIKIKLFVFGVLASSSVVAFEVNTHQAITRCAITNECQQVGARNLNFFVKHALLKGENNYNDEKFEDYDRSYFKYVEKAEEVFKTFKINFSGTSALDLIEAGVVLEDAVYPHADNAGDGRFNNHFYSAQTAIPFSANTSLSPTIGRIIDANNLLRKTDRALYADGLTDAYGQRTDNISWALDKNVTLNPVLGPVRSNQYNIHHAFDYFKKSFEGTADDRRKNQAKLFASMGFIIHMIQDLHSPAHVRNGPHAGGDYLEIYGRYNGGFNLKNGAWNGQGIINVGNNNRHPSYRV